LISETLSVPDVGEPTQVDMFGPLTESPSRDMLEPNSLGVGWPPVLGFSESVASMVGGSEVDRFRPPRMLLPPSNTISAPERARALPPARCP